MPSTVTEKGARRSSTRLADRGGSMSSAVVDSNAKRAADDGPAPSKAATKKAKSTADEPTPTVSMPKKLAVGDTLPALSLSDQAGKTVKIGDLKKAVIFTYPKANTGGCTAQACLYRDEYEQWQKAGFTIYGLSNDGQTSLKNWKEKRAFQYDLLSDPKRELIGLLTGSKTSTPRSHFVIDARGAVALSSIGVKPANSSPDALKFAQSL